MTNNPYLGSSLDNFLREEGILDEVNAIAIKRVKALEILALSLQQPPLPAQIYHYILNFLTSEPTPAEILAFRPTPEMQERLKTLLMRSQAGELTPTERSELDEYERIEHLMVMLKAEKLAERERAQPR
jgi:hypothetical protein